VALVVVCRAIYIYVYIENMRMWECHCATCGSVSIVIYSICMKYEDVGVSLWHLW
jgi:hypothetical protein